MPIGINIKMTRHDPHREEVFEAIITDQDWKYLVLFRNETLRLAGTEWISTGMHAEFSLSAQDGQEPVLSVPNKPSDAQVAEVLHRLRPFLLRNEDLFFEKVMTVFARYLTHPWLRDELQRARDQFLGVEQASMYQLSANLLQLNSEQTLNLWLNAFEFHRDKRKAETFVKASGRAPDDLMLAVFRSLLVDKVNVLLGLGRMVTGFEDHSPSARRRAT